MGEDRLSTASGEPRIRADRAGVELREFRHAPGDRIEFHRFEESDQPLVIGLVHGEIADRHVELDVIVERNELFRQPRLLGILDQSLTPLFLLDLGRALEQRFKVAVLGN